MSIPQHGDVTVDIDFIDAERAYFQHIKSNTLRNLSFEILCISFNKLYSAFKEVEPFVYEKSIQSSIRRDELMNLDAKDMINTYGYGIMKAVYKHAKKHQLPTNIPTYKEIQGVSNAKN